MTRPVFPTGADPTPAVVPVYLSSVERHVLRSCLVREMRRYKTKAGESLIETAPLQELVVKLGGERP